MKKLLFRAASIVLCAALMFTLGACGSKKTESGATADLLDFEDQTGEGLNKDGTGSGSASSAASGGEVGSGVTVTDKVEFDSKDPFANIPKRLKGTTVTFAVWGDEGNDAYKPLLQAFTRDTGIKVEFKMINQDTYTSQVMQNIVAGSAPDLMVSCMTFADMIEVAQPIENLLDLKDDFWDDTITNISTINGHTYFVNSLESVWENHEYIIFNKSLFANNSLRSPRDYWEAGQWSYENAFKCMEQLSKLGYYGGYIHPEVLAASFGAPMVSYDYSTKTFKNNLTNEKVVKACQWYVNLLENKVWATGMGTANFVNGNVGLTYGGCYSSKFNGWYSSMDGSVLDAVPLPTSYEGQPCMQEGCYRGYGIPKNAKNPEGAAYFLRYFLDYDYYKAADIQVFKSKALEKFYFDEFVPLIKKEGISYSHYQDAMKMIDESENSFIILDNQTTAQIPALLASKTNRLDTAVNKLNTKIQSYK